MRQVLIFGLGCLLGVSSICAAVPDTAPSPLEALFDQIQQTSDPNVFLAGLTSVVDPTMTPDVWQRFFQEYFQTRAFTPQLSAFWEYAITNGGDYAPRVVQISAFSAAKALSDGLLAVSGAGMAQGVESVWPALSWLERIRSSLTPEAANSVFEAIVQPLDGRPANLIPYLQPGSAVNPQAARIAIQLCLTLTAYAPATVSRTSQIESAVVLPETTQFLWRNRGIFLFDNGVLGADQIASLDSLLAAIPPQLHSVLAIITIPGYGFDMTDSGLMTDYQLAFIPAIPMDVFSNPQEFILETGQPAAPEFTANAATVMMRAIEGVQFARRPELVVRRDQLLQKADARPASFIRKFIDPSAYYADPGLLIPAASYLWFIDSGTALGMALYYFGLYEAGALEATLILMDTLSGGADTTIMFSISPSGQVSSSRIPIGRSLIELNSGETVMYVTSVSALDTSWTFETDGIGTIKRLIRPGGGIRF